MSERKNTNGPEGSASESLSFEDALSELQAIVHALEEGTLGLEDAIARFETGVALLRNCYQVLEQAERKIEILTGIDSRGNPVTKPFDASATIEQKGSNAGRRRAPGSMERDEAADAECAEDGDDGGKLF